MFLLLTISNFLYISVIGKEPDLHAGFVCLDPQNLSRPDHRNSDCNNTILLSFYLFAKIPSNVVI